VYYWNRNNFEGLKNIGQHYLSKNGYDGFAEYCLLMERGLRKRAFVHLAQFIEQAKSLPVAEQRVLACDLAGLAFDNAGVVHQLRPDPLIKYLTNIFHIWCDENADLAAPYRWFAIIGGDSKYFDEALRRDHEDQISLYCVARNALDDVDYQTHHLAESKLIGTEETVVKTLNLAAEYATRLSASDTKQSLLETVTYFRSLLRAWTEYQGVATNISFPAWCKANGHEFKFLSAHYYNRPFNS